MFLGEESGPGRAKARIWSGRRQKGGSEVAQARNGAKLCLRRHPECQHTASIQDLTLHPGSGSFYLQRAVGCPGPLSPSQQLIKKHESLGENQQISK